MVKYFEYMSKDNNNEEYPLKKGRLYEFFKFKDANQITVLTEGRIITVSTLEFKHTDKCKRKENKENFIKHPLVIILIAIFGGIFGAITLKAIDVMFPSPSPVLETVVKITFENEQ